MEERQLTIFSQRMIKSIQPQSETVINKIRAHSGCFLVFFFETIFYQGRLHTITFKLLATQIN